MEVGRGAMDGAESAVGQGWPFARPAGAITLKMPQAPEGLSSRNKTFGYFSGIMYHMGKVADAPPPRILGIQQQIR